MDKEFHEDLPMHPDLDSTLSSSEDTEENSVPKRKRKCKRTPLLMEYLGKKKNQICQKLKQNRKKV